MDIPNMLTWVNALCVEAQAAANSGDVSKANALAKSPAMRDYWTNVHMLKSITESDFVQWYPDKVRELNTLYEAYQQQAAQTQQIAAQSDKIATLEQKIETMMARLEAFMEAQDTPSDPEPEPEQPKKRRAKPVAADSDSEDQDDPADDAEADPNEAE